MSKSAVMGGPFHRLWLVVCLSVCISLALPGVAGAQAALPPQPQATPLSSPAGSGAFYLPLLLNRSWTDCTDPYEPNGSREWATPLCEGEIQSFLCSAEDVDWFVVCSSDGAPLTSLGLDLYDLPANYDLYVYGGTVELARSVNPGTRPEQIRLYAGLPQDTPLYVLVVGVDGANSASQPYALRLARNLPTPTATATTTPMPPTATATLTPTVTATASSSLPTATPTWGRGPSLSIEPVTSPATQLTQLVRGLTDRNVHVYIECEKGTYRTFTTDGHFALEVDLVPEGATHLTVTAMSDADPTARTQTTVDRNGNPLLIQHTLASPSPLPTATGTASHTMTRTATWTATATATERPSVTVTPSATAPVPTATATGTATATATASRTGTATRTATFTPTGTAAPKPVFRVLVPSEVKVDVLFEVEVILLDFRSQPVTDYVGTIQLRVLPEGLPVAMAASYTFGAADAGRHSFPALAIGGEGLMGVVRVEDEANDLLGVSNTFHIRRELATPTTTGTATLTMTATASPSASPSATQSATALPTSSATGTPSATVTLTSSATVTATSSSTPTETATATASSTSSATATATRTLTQTVTATPSPTATFVPRILILQQGVSGYAGTTDTGISSWYPDTNSGSTVDMGVRSGNEKSALLRFDLNPLPAGARLFEARLELYPLSGSREVTLEAYELLRPWDEAQATWRTPRGEEWWSKPGADAAWVDRAGLPAAQGVLVGSGAWTGLDLTSLVTSWVEHPGGNYGVLIKLISATSTEYQFAASEHWKPEWRPRLILVYGVP